MLDDDGEDKNLPHCKLLRKPTKKPAGDLEEGECVEDLLGKKAEDNIEVLAEERV